MAEEEVTTEMWSMGISTDTLQATEKTTTSEDVAYLNKITSYIWYITPPIILLFGNFGNIMTILIMWRIKSSESVINIYFTALAIIDLVNLDVYLLEEWVGYSFGTYYLLGINLFCKIYNWVTTASTTIGGWFLVGMTVHRAISVVWPHRVNLLCTRRLVVGVVVGMAGFFAVVYSHYLYGYRVRYYNRTGDYRCKMKPGAYLNFVQNVFTYIDLVLYSLLPFLCITIANSILVWKLRATVREFRHKFVEKGSEKVAARERAASSVTWTVVIVSGAYVVLTLPISIYSVSWYVISRYTSTMSEYEQAAVMVMASAMYMLLFCNSAVNFYLYCLTGERFRREFVKLFCPKRLRGVSMTTVVGSSVEPPSHHRQSASVISK